MLTLTQLLAAAIFVPALHVRVHHPGGGRIPARERLAELTQALNDLFWLWFVGIVGTIIVQNITLADRGVHRQG